MGVQVRHMFRAVRPEEGRSLGNAIDVSSYGAAPYDTFSPFTYSPDSRIPVPGQEEVYAASVESIWQGLKVIDGQTDFRMFNRHPKKRRGLVEGHLFGTEHIGALEARERIYRPAYFFFLEHCVPTPIKEEVLARALEDGVVFYDVDANLDIADTSCSLAHSVFLAAFFEGYLERRVLEEKAKIDEAYRTQEFRHETLAEALVRALRVIEKGSALDRALIIRFLEQPGRCDQFTARYYSALLRTLTVP
jgi:hypothetical protein